MLGAHLGVAASTLSATIARLVDLGYIRNSVTSTDKRQRELRLTDLGAQAMAGTSVLDELRVTQLVAALSSDERKIAGRGLALLARAARRLEKRS